MAVIIVGVPTTENARSEVQCCLSEFHTKGLPVRRVDIDKNGGLIDTCSCRIIFRSTNMMNGLRGLKCDACFGFSEEDQCLLNWSHRPTKYDGTFLDYVYEVEHIKEV